MKTIKNEAFLKFEIVSEFLVVGFSMQMSLADFRPDVVWHKFMSSKDKLSEYDHSCFYDVNIYDEHYFESYNPNKLFNKFAGVRTDDEASGDFEKLIIPKGRYAVFIHEGLAKDISKTFQYIYSEWLLTNNEKLDDRPHFMKLPANYNRNDEIVSEEIYIPLK